MHQCTLAYVQVSESCHTLHLLSQSGHMTVSASQTSFLQHIKHFIYYTVHVLIRHRYCGVVMKLTWGVSCWRRQGHKGRLWPQWEQVGSADMCTSPTIGSTRPLSPRSSSWNENTHTHTLMGWSYKLIIACRKIIHIYIAHLQFINIVYEYTMMFATNFI